MQLHEISEHNTKIWVSDHVYSDFKLDWFERVPLPAKSSINQWQSGRQSVVKFTVGARKMVLRHYCRGGLPARFSKDHFMFRSFESSRPFKELILLQRMRQLELPVPEPIAARCRLKGVLYNADIVMSEIVNSKTLAQMVAENKLEKETWKKIGQIIWKFHQQGIQHVDLNVNNILLDQEGNVYLIDFDRCVQRPYAQSWAQVGVNRLKRSLEKQKESKKMVNF